MSGVWSEADKRTVELPEDDATTFQQYVDLLYTDRVHLDHKANAQNINDSVDEEHESIVKLYILAEKLQDVVTKNQSVAALIASEDEDRSDGISYTMGSDTIKNIYNGTPSNSLLRKVAVDSWTSWAQASWVAQDKALPEEFVRELLISVLDRRTLPKKTIDIKDISSYMEAE